MFEDKTYENLLQDVLDNAPNDIDKRQGSIFYDAVSGVLLKIAKLYTDIELISKMTTLATAAGEALDAKASEYGITRLAATKAKYYAVFEGAAPENGQRFFHDGNYFRALNIKNVICFEAEIPGEGQNNIIPGTPAVPVDNIDQLTYSAFGEIYENGADQEEDENLRKRIIEKLAGPAENGNIQHYKTWCESIDGVGRARIFPLWNGANTVKAVLIDTVGKPLGNAKLAEVQQLIDPADKGLTAVVDGIEYVVGDGLGNGTANIGAHFTAVSAVPFYVNIDFYAEIASGSTAGSIEKEAAEEIENHLKELILSNDENVDIVIRLSAIGAILSRLKGLSDYSGLTLNGNAKNLTVGQDSVPVLQEVNVNEIL